MNKVMFHVKHKFKTNIIVFHVKREMWITFIKIHKVIHKVVDKLVDKF